MDAIEVWNGPWTWEDEAAVQTWDRMIREEEALPAVGASDAHDPGDVIGLPQTVVQADRLGQEAIIDSLAAGRAYIAESDDVAVEVTAKTGSREAGIGEGLELDSQSETPVEVHLEVRGAPGTEATVHTQESIVKIVPVNDSHHRATFETNAKATDFVRVEVRQANEDRTMVALTNPIFFGESWP